MCGRIDDTYAPVSSRQCISAPPRLSEKNSNLDVNIKELTHSRKYTFIGLTRITFLQDPGGQQSQFHFPMDIFFEFSDITKNKKIKFTLKIPS